MTTTFVAIAKEGKLDFGSDHNRARLHDHLIANEGKEYRVQKVEYKRTESQHRYYSAYLSVVSREYGNTVEELHQWAKRMFLPPTFIVVKGQEIKIPTSTKTLSKLQMGEYLERIAAETLIPLPDPKLLGISQHDAILKDNE